MAFGAGLIFLLSPATPRRFRGWPEWRTRRSCLSCWARVDLRSQPERRASRRLIATVVLVARRAAREAETTLLLPALGLAWEQPVSRCPRALLTRPWRSSPPRHVCAAHWLFREARFGSALGVQCGMAPAKDTGLTSPAYLLWCFVPPGRVAMNPGSTAATVGLAPAAALATPSATRSRAGLGLLSVALVILLAPALPLHLAAEHADRTGTSISLLQPRARWWRGRSCASCRIAPQPRC